MDNTIWFDCSRFLIVDEIYWTCSVLHELQTELVNIDRLEAREVCPPQNRDRGPLFSKLEMRGNGTKVECAASGQLYGQHEEGHPFVNPHCQCAAHRYQSA